VAMGMRMELFVEDVARSVAFYQEVLGFEVRDGGSKEFTSVRNGGVMLGICQRRALPPDHYFTQPAFEQRKGVGVEIVLEVDDLKALYQRVLDQGYPVYEALQERPWSSVDFRLVDPDGYYLRLTDSAAVARTWERLLG
jgi:lactoylglutathione lyase